MKAMLAQPCPKGKDLSGWWASEKFDGVRAIWTGTRFISREGNEFPAPPEIISAMPTNPLDGELWLGRGRFQATLNAVRAADWSAMRYMVFDLPATAEPFEARQAALADLCLPAFCTVATQTLIRDAAHLDAIESDILGSGGEGIIVRAPASDYVPRRSTYMLKIKRGFMDDARVVAHTATAAVLDYLGQTFRLACPEMPAIGSRVTFAFLGYTEHGRPRHASYIATRDYE
jgi:DNA ligase 1